MTPTWDPQRYLTFADERGRPFVELMARIDPRGEGAPRAVVDLGCGPGNLTALLALRWPDARVDGVDSSPEMIARARTEAAGITFDVADLRDWIARDRAAVDVLISNATLQWVPDHLDLLPALVAAVRPGGWLAFQVPGNFDQPSHTLLHEVAERPAYRDHAHGATRPAAHDAATYLRALAGLGCEVDAWETTYLHVLRGEDPVFTWISGTGARPVLAALPDGLRTAFVDEYKALLRAAYPPMDVGGRPGVVLSFRRVFAVARVPSPPFRSDPSSSTVPSSILPSSEAR